MSYENWKDKAQGFQTVDVRHIQGSFFEGLKKRAEALVNSKCFFDLIKAFATCTRTGLK